MSVQSKLNQYIKDNGIKLTYLAKKSGLKYELLRRCLLCDRKMSADEFVAVLGALQLEVKDIA